MSLFDCPGNVHPQSYDWKKDFGGLAHSTRESRLFYVELDVSKVLGLAQYAEELEEAVRVTVKPEVHIEDLKKIELLEKQVRDLEKKLKEKEVNSKLKTAETKKPGSKKKEESSELF